MGILKVCDSSTKLCCFFDWAFSFALLFAGKDPHCIPFDLSLLDWKTDGRTKEHTDHIISSLRTGNQTMYRKPTISFQDTMGHMKSVVVRFLDGYWILMITVSDYQTESHDSGQMVTVHSPFFSVLAFTRMQAENKTNFGGKTGPRGRWMGSRRNWILKLRRKHARRYHLWSHWKNMVAR
jgi:hypothetical protein